MTAVTNLNLQISTYGYGEASLFEFFKSRSEAGLSTHNDEVKVYGSESSVSRKISSMFTTADGGGCSVIADDDCTYLIIPPGMVSVTGGDKTSTITVYGGLDEVDSVANLLRNNLNVIGSKIHWYYGQNGESTTIPVNGDNLPITEMYPSLSKSLEQYYDDYVNSSSSILILIGPPGTGKTSFIRGLLHHTNTSAVVSYDPSILEKDSIFAGFMGGNEMFMILEDSDSFLSSRSKGNTVMHKFLNIGDGLVSSRNKKLVFTTNLPSIRDIDPALIRPGRCFDILNFPRLTPAQGAHLLTTMGLPLRDLGSDMTLAEILHPDHKVVNDSVGFVK